MFDDSVSTAYSSIWASMNSWFTPTVLFVLLNVMIGTIAFTSSIANHQQSHHKQQQHQEEQDRHQETPKITRSPSILQRIKSINLYNHRSQEPVVKNTNFDRHQETPFEPQTHYIFEPAHEHATIEPQNTQYHVQESQTQYHFHQENLQETQTQFHFQENLQETQSKYHFQQTHQENLQSSIFQEPHEQKLEDMETHEEEEEEEEELKSLDEVYSQLKDHHVTRSRSDTGEPAAKLPAKMKKSASMKSPFGHFEEEDIVEARRPATTREGNVAATGDVDAKADDFINKFKQQLKLQRVDSILRYKDMVGRGT